MSSPATCPTASGSPAGSTGIVVEGDYIGTDAHRRPCPAQQPWEFRSTAAEEQHHRRHHARRPRRHLGQCGSWRRHLRLGHVEQRRGGRLHRHQRRRHRGRGQRRNGVDIVSGASSTRSAGRRPAPATSSRATWAVGVDIADSGTSGNVVEGDYIGTNAAGTVALGNGDQRRGHRLRRDVPTPSAGPRPAPATSSRATTTDGVADQRLGDRVQRGRGRLHRHRRHRHQALANGQDGVDILSGATSNTLGGTTARPAT